MPEIAPAAPAAETVVAPVVIDAVVPPAAPITIGTPAVEPNAPAPAASVSYEPTGDAGLDVALDFVGRLGIAMDHPAMQATVNGDFSLIKAHLATMGDKATGWQQMVALAEDSHKRTTEAATEKAGKVTAAVHAVAGGPENWATVSAWAAANATPEEKAELNAMFAAGTTQARAAAQMLVGLHAKAPGTTVNPAPAIGNASASGSATGNSGPMSIREYSDAVAVLSRKVGSHALHSHPEYAALGKRLAINS